MLGSDVEYMIVHPEAVAEAEILDGQMKIGFGSYHTLVMPQLDYIPLAVLEKLKRFEKSGGKILWIDQVPRLAEHAKNDQKVKNILKNADKVHVDQFAGLINNSYSPDFDLTFTPGTDQLTIGRFHKNDEQVYLLVNRMQEAISVFVLGQRVNNVDPGKIRVLDPSTGEIREVSLPASLSLEANRSLMLIPRQKYLTGKLLINQ